MAFAILDGDITLRVLTISEGEPELVGDETRSDSGQLRGAITAEKRSWTMGLSDMTEAEYQTLRSRVAFGAQLAMTGDGVPNITVRTRIRSADYLRQGDTATDFVRVVSIEVVEV